MLSPLTLMDSMGARLTSAHTSTGAQRGRRDVRALRGVSKDRHYRSLQPLANQIQPFPWQKHCPPHPSHIQVGCDQSMAFVQRRVRTKPNS